MSAWHSGARRMVLTPNDSSTWRSPFLTDPAHATARGLLGLVEFRGQWQSPEAIHDKLEADETTSAALAEYNGRRARMGNSADAHWKIAMWCEQQGLKPEATAHLTMVTQLDPGREAAWKRLGYKKQGRRWVTDLQLAAEKAEAEAQKKADKRWTTLLAKLRSGLDDKSKQADVTKALEGISDPRASRRSGRVSPPARRPINSSPYRCWGRSIRRARRERWRSWPLRASRPR